MDCCEFRYALRLMSPGPDRLKTMAALRAIRPDLSPAQAKTMVDSTPVMVLTDIRLNDRDALARAFRGVADADMIVWPE